MTGKKFDGILICSDIDHTLLYHFRNGKDPTVPENAAKAIKYFQENGGRFTLATGRFPRFAANNLKQYVKPNAPLITLNGAVIYDAESDLELYRCPINDDITRLTYDVIERFPNMRYLSIQADGTNYIIRHRDGGGYKYHDAMIEGSEYQNIDTREEFAETFSNLTVFKMLYCFPSRSCIAARNKIKVLFPEYDVSRSWPSGVELQCFEAGKGNGTRRLAELLGDVRLLVCVGDYENDISMLKSADIGYAVANAIKAVKGAAHRVTTARCRDGAIAEIIEDLEREYAHKQG